LDQYYNNKPDLGSAADVSVVIRQTTPNINAILNEGGHISGAVTTANGSPLANIVAQVYRDHGGGDWQWAGRGQTDANGHYTVDGLLSGVYRVHFFDWSRQYFAKYYQDATDIANGTDVTVTQGQTTPNINVTLAEGGHISGTVTKAPSARAGDAAGTPLARIEVVAVATGGILHEGADLPFAPGRSPVAARVEQPELMP